MLRRYSDIVYLGTGALRLFRLINGPVRRKKHGSPRGVTTKTTYKIILSLIFVFLTFSMTISLGLTAVVNDTPALAQVWTDKTDYQTGEIVTIYGSGFTADTAVTLQVTNVQDGITTTLITASDQNGNFTATYQIDAQGAPLYRIDATDGTNNVSVTFTDTSLTVKNVRTGVTRSIDGTLYARAGDVLTLTSNYNSGDGKYVLRFEPETSGSGGTNYIPGPWGISSGSYGPVNWTIPNVIDGGYMVDIYYWGQKDRVHVIIGATIENITLAPAVGLAGTTVTLSVDEMLPNHAVTAYFDGLPITLDSSTTSGLGTLVATFTVPSSTIWQ
jgi:hypothetical protein